MQLHEFCNHHQLQCLHLPIASLGHQSGLHAVFEKHPLESYPLQDTHLLVLCFVFSIVENHVGKGLFDVKALSRFAKYFQAV